MTAVPGGYRYGECRLLGHGWTIVPSDWTPTFGEPFTVRCERCDLERRDSLNRNTGDVEARRYVWPEGYQFSRDSDDEVLPTRADFRVAWLEGVIEESRRKRRRKAS